VLGGSQGAKALNQILPAALSRVNLSLTVIHQCGRAHVDAVTEQYQACAAAAGDGKSPLQVEVIPFIADMPRALADADLVVGRAGAGAVSEITAVGRPSLLIPYPYASGDHQRVNAELLEQAGAARCLLEADANVARVAAELEALLTDRASLDLMARAAAQLGRPTAADLVARDFLALSGLIPAIRGAAPTGGELAVHNPLSEVA
jgi:UDP-N-acetylglucosamine--N-acetylmuramyl-(pentapeptide) pyrophosphoryl-undecaprenol N-acetylglucosamine transferase